MEQRGCARFKLKAETHPGQTIKILGSHPSLGLWNPDNAVELSTNEIIYPDWTTQLIFLPLNTCIEYKYIFKSLDNITWEASYNRKITLIQNNALIEDVHGNPVSKVFYSSVGIHETEEVFNEDVKFDDSNTVLIVSYLLPLTATISDTGSWNFELTKVVWQSQLYNVIKNSKINFMWLGLAGIHPNTEDQQQDLISTMKEKFNCIPIFVDKEDLELHELFFSKVLYKIMHNIIDTSINAGLNSNEELWNAYKRVNIYFSDQILANYTGQMIWIHGSQLLLIPSYISRKTREILNIGFFLHHPFPSSEIYRVFPHREAILHALCCCDLIGFHLFEYARNFFGCCKRVLSLDIELTKGGYLGLNYYGRHIMVKSEHIGIQPQMIEKICAGVIYKNTFETLSGKYEGKKVILSIDAPFELAGIPLKLKAFQLAKRNIKEKVVFLQILVSHSYNFETAGVKQQIFEIQKEINAEYNDQVLEIIEKDLTNEERYAYMAISSGLVISSIKDGLCLQPFEYLIIKKDKQCGVVLSEFTGVSTALNSPIKVNPFNIQDLEKAILELLSNSNTIEQQLKIQRDYKYIMSKNALDWTQHFLSDLKRSHKDTINLHYMVHGLGDKLKLIALNKNFRKLNKRNVLEAYNRSNNRMLFFDNEGTLSNFMKQTEIDRKVGPSQRIIKALDCLCDDERNTVYVITGRPRDVVYNWFGSVYNLGMAAEYGALIKWSNSQEWESFFNVQSNWKVTAKEIISGYSERTEGSLLVEKESSVVFLYREADPEFGSYQAKELVIQLDFLLKPFMGEIEISEGIGYVEVKPQGINKGTALLRAIEKTSELKGPVDFIMAIGDDSSDEDMFKMVNLLKKQNSQILYSEKIPAFTCTLGIKPSSASYFLLDAAKVVNLLEHINGKTNRAKRNFSYDDLSKKSPAKALISNTILIHQLQVLEDLSEEENNLPRIESTDAFNI